MPPQPIKAITPSELTEGDCHAMAAHAWHARDDRMQQLALQAAEETGDTPARKETARFMNDQRRKLAAAFGAEFIESEGA